MDHPASLGRTVRGSRRRVASLLAALVLGPALGAGCSGLYWNLKKNLRSPGERLKAFPEKVWKEYGCQNRRLPFVHIEKNEIAPPRMRAGSEFNHRIVYVLCPSSPTRVLSGTLETKILFRGRAIVEETDSAFEIKPGRWVVDTFIEVPPQAEVGIYALELEFRSTQVHFRKRLSFAVDQVAATPPGSPHS